ncbi:hypothetical protein ACAW74_20130 [Fibrella sp. WM1]|uniref:hypothetical protein n=1 Tax=Fibrella musci TaxID=3242485 RepID=UPI00351FB15A
MDELDRRAFADLVGAVVVKCFGHPMDAPLSEPESKHLSIQIEAHTGLVIGWRSIKNYVAFLLNPSLSKQENPSVATLDTLARYVFDAPPISEAERKKTEPHFPYWFRFREQISLLPMAEQPEKKRRKSPVSLVLVGLLVVIGVSCFFLFRRADLERVQDDFQVTDEAAMSRNGWFLKDKNERFWNRRAQQPGQLTLFTLKGDNWPQAGEKPRIQNLLLREIHDDCFRTDLHVKGFIPGGNWQQVGLLLLEDSLFTGKSIRLSLSYNNYFGGYVKPGEVLLQAIASHGLGDDHLEEFIHQPLFPVGTTADQRIAATNLKNVAFRIEKQGQKFRFLYSASPVDNFSFKEVATYEVNMTPKYIGLFALKGFVDTTAILPVSVRSFRLEGLRCD